MKTGEQNPIPNPIENSIENSIQNWLKILLAPGIGVKSALDIYQKYPSLSDFFSDFENVKLKIETKKWLKNPNQSLIDQHLDWLDQSNQHHIICFDDQSYPNALKQIANPPILLFVKGNCNIIKEPQIAMVGSRNPSTPGIKTSEIFARSLSQLGWLITSGLASGIDSAAHRGALEANQPTISVMGTGINLIYPSFNQKLAASIVENGGALISEFPLDSPANSYHFPQRNRIISALSLACLVIEASEKSGSLITAKLANDFGREVYAIPGYIYDDQFKGTNLLISQGAHIVLSLDHLIDELCSDFAHLGFKQKKISLDEDNTQGNQAKQLSKEQEKMKGSAILKVIDYQPKTIDEIVFKSRMPIDKVQGEISLLELSDLIFILPDGQIVKKPEY